MWRCGSRDGGRSGRCTWSTGCAPPPSTDARHCEAVCAELGVALALRHPRHRPRGRQRPGVGAARALRGRRRSSPPSSTAARARRGGAEPGGDRRRSHRERPGRDDPLPPRLLAEPPGAARDARAHAPPGPAVPALVRPLLAATREQTTAHCRARGLRYRDDESNDSTAYARGRIRGELLPGAASASIPPPSPTWRRPRRSSPTKPRCSTSSSTPCSPARPRARVRLERAPRPAAGAAPADRAAAGRRGRRRARGRGGPARGGGGGAAGARDGVAAPAPRRARERPGAGSCASISPRPSRPAPHPARRST